MDTSLIVALVTLALVVADKVVPRTKTKLDDKALAFIKEHQDEVVEAILAVLAKKGK
jgi:hypothetical protein